MGKNHLRSLKTSRGTLPKTTGITEYLLKLDLQKVDKGDNKQVKKKD